jgi:hypothetical protein
MAVEEATAEGVRAMERREAMVAEDQVEEGMEVRR